MKKLRQAMLSLWFDDQTPSTDPPAEIIGVMVGKGGEGVDLERSQQFASDVLRIHWNGECACQEEREDVKYVPMKTLQELEQEACEFWAQIMNDLWEWSKERRRTKTDIPGVYFRWGDPK